MKQALKSIFGLALIAAGILWILNILDIVVFNFSTDGWWALFVIVPCLFGLFNDKEKLGPTIGLGIGILLLLSARGVISWHLFGQMTLAVIIIAVGLNLLFFRNFGRYRGAKEQVVPAEGNREHPTEFNFGRNTLSYAGEHFEGADLKVAFGALVIDLRDAIIDSDVTVSLDAGFCGVQIYVPEHMAVRIIVNSSFGGVKDCRQNRIDSGSPVIFITGKVGFAGVEIH